MKVILVKRVVMSVPDEGYSRNVLFYYERT